MTGQERGFAQIVNAAPQELAGVGGVVAHVEPGAAIMVVLRADDFARGLLLVGGEQLVVTIIGADDVEQVGQAVVVIVADVGAEEGLSHGARGIAFMENMDEAGEDSVWKGRRWECRESRCRRCKV